MARYLAKHKDTFTLIRNFIILVFDLCIISSWAQVALRICVSKQILEWEWRIRIVIALGYELDDWGFESLLGLGIFLLTTASRQALGPTHPPIQWVLGALSLGIKRPGRDAQHWHPSSAEVKNAWSYTCIPPVRFHGVVLSWKSTEGTLMAEMALIYCNRLQLKCNASSFCRRTLKPRRLLVEWKSCPQESKIYYTTCMLNVVLVWRMLDIHDVSKVGSTTICRCWVVITLKLFYFYFWGYWQRLGSNSESSDCQACMLSSWIRMK